jgi:hypothetical protein
MLANLATLLAIGLRLATALCLGGATAIVIIQLVEAALK